MEETKALVRHVDRRVRFVSWCCVALFVLLLGSQVQLQLRNRDIDKMRDAVTRAETASIKASDDLAAAIKATRQPQDPNGPIPTALREIHDIKVILQNLDAYVKNTLR